MKELMKNYKVWLIASLTLLIMLAAVCISFSGNYHELEGYREKEYNAAEQQKVISKLTEENTRLVRGQPDGNDTGVCQELL